MSGKVVHQAVVPHHCTPGWEWVWTDDPSSVIASAIGGHYYGVPPTSWMFPKGTVWECACGRTYVSRGAPRPNSPGYCEWRREHVIARWLRSHHR